MTSNPYSLHRRDFSGGVAEGSLASSRAAHPFENLTREQFLGSPKITSDGNARDLIPSEILSLKDIGSEPFFVGEGLVAKYGPKGAAVFCGSQVIASYNFGDTLVVDKKHRRQGIAEELVYQWRMRNPGAKTAPSRTKKAQKVQEKVWDRIRGERALSEAGFFSFAGRNGEDQLGSCDVATDDDPGRVQSHRP